MAATARTKVTTVVEPDPSANGSTSAHPVAGPSTISQAPTPTSRATSSGMQTRHKRILPSRSRRGGPGVGSCDADLMILDTLKRRQENEPLIPRDTRFVLTTNSALVPATSPSGLSELHLNTSAYERYFDKPEVLKAYREQQIIETPEFSVLSEHAAVGGRFRPRSSEDVRLCSYFFVQDRTLIHDLFAIHMSPFISRCAWTQVGADTSDAAYEKRHRKYETFEKRQRLREKEKLQHEHYKLKERIDQLQSMDVHAFLSLPSSSFNQNSSTSDPFLEEPIPFDPTGAHAHNLATLHEGVRRKAAMLDAAMTLEDRYRTLLNLNSDRRRNESRAQSLGASMEQDLQSAAEEEEGEEEEESVTAPVKQEKIKLTIKWPPRGLPSVTASPIPTSPFLKARMGVVSPRAALVRQTKQPVTSPLAPDASGLFPAHVSTSAYSPTPYQDLANTAASPNPPTVTSATNIVRRQPRKRAPDGTFLKKGVEPESWTPSATRPRKRPRSVLHDAKDGESVGEADHSYGTAASPSVSTHHRRPEPSSLVVSAMRTASTPNARHTQRHVTAFGVKLPHELEIVRDFQIPEWAWPQSGSSAYEGEGSSATYARSDVAVEEIL